MHQTALPYSGRTQVNFTMLSSCTLDLKVQVWWLYELCGLHSGRMVVVVTVWWSCELCGLHGGCVGYTGCMWAVGCMWSMWWLWVACGLCGGYGLHLVVVCGLYGGRNRMIGVDGDANGKWLVKIDSFGTEVEWCLSSGMGKGSSEMNI